MADTVLVDTGPLVAMLCQDDQYHGLCCQVLQAVRPPLITTWPVVTEAAWLLRNVPSGVRQLLQLLEHDLVRCAELGDEAAVWLRTFLDKYSDLRPQLADASLVYVAEMLGTDLVFTLDRRDFVVLRLQNGNPLRLLPTTIH